MAAPRGAFKGVLEGYDATLRLFDKYHKDVLDGFQEEMEYWAHRILNLSLVYCPTSEGGDWPPSVEPGFLRSTGQVVPDGQFKFRITYSAWYAAYVHEVPTYQHTPPTRWKFLEFAVSEIASEMSRETGQNFGIRFRSFDVDEQTSQFSKLESQQP